MTTETQQKAILKHLQEGYIMTPMDGWRVASTMKLSTRIGELIRKGHPIVKGWLYVSDRKKVRTYKLAKV